MMAWSKENPDTSTGLWCAHGYAYPTEDPSSRSGPWVCNPDGSNPECPNCEPDAWRNPDRGSVEVGE